jgi:hypothetical protein
MRKTVVINGKRYTVKLREMYANKERAVPVKKLYTRKNEKKIIEEELS